MKDGRWHVQIFRNKALIFSTSSRTLEAAIEARDNFLNSGT